MVVGMGGGYRFESREVGYVYFNGLSSQISA
jgi:hypothetical protein